MRKLGQGYMQVGTRIKKEGVYKLGQGQELKRIGTRNWDKKSWEKDLKSAWILMCSGS